MKSAMLWGLLCLVFLTSSTISVFSRIMAQLYWGPGTVAGQSCASNTLPIAGARPNLDAAILIAPNSTNNSLVLRASINTYDQAIIMVCNPTTAPIAAVAGNYVVVIPW